ncbi:aminoacyl tRNA synthase complex-interacting multifunctional protein 1a [Entelurus aequoreus]|uniref:aminoacyl tRNA synthase complex-interacting multifunctional protein 1a n=1 Tax=Entelurus aequoreus TaxID=161455 RepID=UPI002B1DCDB5|nr:aminoacyl tRNA synthase complex-interacting multifunctional protein 1a [Entelurus aequoreus]
MGRSRELSDFQRGIVVGCHMCKKTLREIANLLNLPRSTVSNVVLQWKREGRTCPLPRCGRPHILKEEHRQVLESLAQEHTFPSLQALTCEFQRASGAKVSKATVSRELREMGLRRRGSTEGKARERKKAQLPSGPDNAADGPNKAEVSRLDLRVGCIIRTMQLPETDNLYLRHVDVGEAHPRTVVSECVPVNQLQNGMAVLLCNLKPTQVRGVASQAVVVCVRSPDKVEVLSPPNGAFPGDRVTFRGLLGKPDRELDSAQVWDKVHADLRTDGQCVATYKGAPLEVAGKGACRAETLSDCEIVLTHGGAA